MQPQQNPSGQLQVRTVLSWCAFVCAVLAASVEVFLHRSRSFGERYLGLQAAAAIPIILLFTTFWPDHDVSPLLVLLIAYVFMCALARIGVVLRRRQDGQREHTYYNGRPRVMRFVGRIGERTVKLIVEPMLVFLVGVFTLPASEPLGGYLMLASFGLLVSVHLSAGYEETRALEMHDALISQQQVVERFRDLRGDR